MTEEAQSDGQGPFQLINKKLDSAAEFGRRSNSSLIEMPNLVAVFKTEITRLARKELRGDVDALRKQVAAQRSEIAALKRQLSAIEKSVRTQGKQLQRSAPSTDKVDEEGGGRPLRFSAKGLATHRARLGLSAEQFGRLVGTTGQSIYAWEQGKSVPRAASLTAIAEVRSLGKRAVAAKLAELAAA